MTDVEVVRAEIGDTEVEARVIGRTTEAAYGRGPRDVLRVKVESVGTFRVPEADATPV